MPAQNPLHLAASGLLLAALFAVAFIGVRSRNNPAISLKCVLLAFLLSLAFYFLSEAIYQFTVGDAKTLSRFIGSGNIMQAVNNIRVLGCIQALFGIMVTAVLILVRSGQPKADP